MKVKTLSMVAALAIGAGIFGAANTASAEVAAAPAVASSFAGTGIILAHYPGRPVWNNRRRCRLWYHLGFVKGIARFRYMYRKYCRVVSYPNRCRKLYYLGVVKGIPYYKHLYRKYCRNVGQFRKCRKLYYLGFVKGISYYKYLYYRLCRRLSWRR